jgi:hypothetical protein
MRGTVTSAKHEPMPIAKGKTEKSDQERRQGRAATTSEGDERGAESRRRGLNGEDYERAILLGGEGGSGVLKTEIRTSYALRGRWGTPGL